MNALSEAQEKNISLLTFLPQEPTHLVIYDDGEFTPVLLKKGGWIMDSDGDPYVWVRKNCSSRMKDLDVIHAIHCLVRNVDCRFIFKGSSVEFVQTCRFVNRVRCV